MWFEPTIPFLKWAKIFLWTGDQRIANELSNTNREWTHTDIHALNEIWNHNLIARVIENIACNGGSVRRKSATLHKHRMNARRHPCLEWDSNPQSSFSIERKYLFGREIIPSQIRYITQAQNERRRHQGLEWYSNPQSNCSSERKYCL
jgi:hypothetical protein